MLLGIDNNFYSAMLALDITRNKSGDKGQIGRKARLSWVYSACCLGEDRATRFESKAARATTTLTAMGQVDTTFTRPKFLAGATVAPKRMRDGDTSPLVTTDRKRAMSSSQDQEYPIGQSEILHLGLTINFMLKYINYDGKKF